MRPNPSHLSIFFKEKKKTPKSLSLSLSFSLMEAEIEQVRSVLGPEPLESDILRALSLAGNNPNRAINIILDTPGFLTPRPLPVRLSTIGSGSRISAGVKQEQFEEGDISNGQVKKEPHMGSDDKGPILKPFHGGVKKEELDVGLDEKNGALVPFKRDENFVDLTKTHHAPYLNPCPISSVKPEKVLDRRIQVVDLKDLENGEFPEERDWFLLGRTTVAGMSTCKGRKLEFNEIVHFAFPSADGRTSYRKPWVSAKAAGALLEIVRFSTKRNGEIGRLPKDWTRILIPLVNSSKVKICGRCVAAPLNLSIMSEIILYVSFYIHSSIFTEDNNSSWSLVAPPRLDSPLHPLLTLFKLIKLKPFKMAEFTPEELDTRKRTLNLTDDAGAKRRRTGQIQHEQQRRADQTQPEQDKDEQAISESELNKIVGTADVYNLEEMDPPDTLLCDLRPYQKQALYWMSELEKGVDVEQAAKTLHPCWAAYRIFDTRAPTIYVNVFSGEAMTQFPCAMQMARGGILADAMGLGKTVMTIALILGQLGRGNPDDQGRETMTRSQRNNSSIIKGGTLIVCPMALLGQWKDEIETHSKPGTVSVFVHYGGDRTTNPKVIAEYDIVLTTYGVLTSSYNCESGREGIFHSIEWSRVMLDEAHTIKSSKTQVAQSAFTLTSHCRWCLTGTPLQNKLEDLYSLLCFLHVEPWCNLAWWHKFIQKPYESGDERGLKLVKAILRPLMLRRTKETTDKEGRPILVLPPVDIQLVECETSEAERHFYDALFRKSKVRFDQFVTEGNVLRNYASILELLLRLRQCCNHPFLVMSRSKNEEVADLNVIARCLLENTTTPNSNFSNRTLSGPTRAYVEEVVDDIRSGNVRECPICLESADDPVITPCAHRMCRECLLASWRSPSGGPCPICRSTVSRSGLMTCPSVNLFRLDLERNWKEPCKVLKLMNFLESLRRSGSGEKSIVFSQWTSFLDLLQAPLMSRKIGFLRYDGSLAQKQRERVLKEFNECSNKPVLLMSLKAGGVGLNLTAASNVFLMDPWWNPAVEEQAIMRIHRIGQKRQVCVRRFIVKDTVEDRLQQVQVRKQRMIAGALTDEEVRDSRIEELKMLFR